MRVRNKGLGTKVLRAVAALPLTEGPSLPCTGADELPASRSWATASDEGGNYKGQFAGLWHCTPSPPRNADVDLMTPK